MPILAGMDELGQKPISVILFYDSIKSPTFNMEDVKDIFLISQI